MKGRNKDTDIENGLLDTEMEGEGEMNWKSKTDMCVCVCVCVCVCRIDSLVGSCCTAQGAQLSALCLLYKTSISLSIQYTNFF